MVNNQLVLIIPTSASQLLTDRIIANYALLLAGVESRREPGSTSSWQAIIEIKLSIDPVTGNASYPVSSAAVLANYSTSAGKLAVRSSMVNPHIPSTQSGNLVVFDASPGNDLSVGKGKAARDTANQRFHLGAVQVYEQVSSQPPMAII